MNNNVCYFGSYGSFNIDYSRNRIIKKGLIKNNIKVYECTSSGFIIKRYFRLTLCFLKNKDKFQNIIVGFPGHYDVPLAFLLGKIFQKKVFFDIFASTYETYVLDREVVRQNSVRAKFFFMLDWLGLKLADYVIIDTIAHGKFYSQFYGLNPQKRIVVYVGSDTDYFYPRKVKEETDVLFYGSYQPLQGVDVIIKAASKLPKVKFKLIGEGQTRRSAENQAKDLKLKNVEFADWLPLEKLAEEIAKAKITLGIFGTTQKANVVIPNKVYDYLATNKPVITANTEAIRKLFKTGINCILTKPGDSQDLALAIDGLLKNADNRLKIAKTGHNIFKSKLTTNSVVSNLISKLNEK